MAARNELTLQCKIEVLDYVRRNPSPCSGKVTDVVSCGHTQIQNVFQYKEAILSKYKESIPASWKRHQSWRWTKQHKWSYVCMVPNLVRQSNVPVSGPVLQKEAHVIAVPMGHPQFKASNGWLESTKEASQLLAIYHQWRSSRCVRWYSGELAWINKRFHGGLYEA